MQHARIGCSFQLIHSVCGIEESGRRLPVLADEQKSLVGKQPLQPADAKTLKAVILGAPNAGKSTLLNSLIGWKVAPVSSKVHTTRSKTVGVLTEGNKQVVFLDTPGLITPHAMKRHTLNKRLLIDPHSSLIEADIIVVDASEVWSRNKLPPEVLKLLHLHNHTPSILVLNKVDKVKLKTKLIECTKKLTAGTVGGVSTSVNTKKYNPNRNIITRNDIKSLFDRMDQELNVSNDTTMSEEENQPISLRLSQSDVTGGLQAPGYQPDEAEAAEITAHTKRSIEEMQLDATSMFNDEIWHNYYHKKLNKLYWLVKDASGWPHFEQVFMVSAKDDDGVDDIREHLFRCALDSDWVFDSDVVTTMHPVKLAQQCVWEKLLDALPRSMPYTIRLKTITWETDESGFLQIAMLCVCAEGEAVYNLLREKGGILKKVATSAKQELMNAFKRDLSLKISVVRKKSPK